MGQTKVWMDWFKILFVETHWTVSRWMPFFILCGNCFFLFSLFFIPLPGSLPYCCKLYMFFVVFLSLPLPFHNFCKATFFFKNYPRISVSDLYNKRATYQKKTKQKQKRARCRRHTKVVSRSPHTTSLVTLPPGKCNFFVLFDYAVSISFRTKNCSG